MYLVYATLAFVEIFIFLASSVALAVFVVRAIIRSLLAPKEPPPKLTPEDLRRLKRADARSSG
jgi:hypothetical protein